MKDLQGVFRAVVAIICVTLTSFSALKDAQSADDLPVEIGYIEFPPFFFTGADGEAKGDLIELAKKRLEKTGRKWRTAAYPAARLMENVRQGRTDVAMLIRHPRLNDAAWYGETPITSIELRAYSIGERPPVKHWSDLKGRSVVLLRGYGYSGWILPITDPKNDISYSFADGHEAAFSMLSRNRADYLLDYRKPAEDALKSTKIAGLQHQMVTKFNVFFPGIQENAER